MTQDRANFAAGMADPAITPLLKAGNERAGAA